MTTQDFRRGIRAASLSVQNADIVSLLGPDPAFDHSLQTIGDALLLALNASGGSTRSGDTPTQATRLAQQCAEALRRRDWRGDVELADQLDRATGTGVTPMLRALPVDLEELSTVLEGDPVYGGGYIELSTGQVWTQSAIDDGVLDDDEQESFDDQENWLFVNCTGSRDGYRDMAAFIETVADEQRADRLAIAIEGRGAFRRFRSVLDRWDDELDRWHVFSDDRKRGRAREFLADAGFRPAVPARA
jgi:hypothetical protein